MKYEFGVGSSKWSLEADNDDIAHVVMVMHIRNHSIPIVVYKPTQKAITGSVILDMDNMPDFIVENADALRKANNSIEKIEGA